MHSYSFKKISTWKTNGFAFYFGHRPVTFVTCVSVLKILGKKLQKLILLFCVSLLIYLLNMRMYLMYVYVICNMSCHMIIPKSAV